MEWAVRGRVDPETAFRTPHEVCGGATALQLHHGCAKLVDWLGFPVQFQSSPSLVTNIWKKPVVFALKWIQFNPFQFQFDIPETNPIPV